MSLRSILARTLVRALGAETFGAVMELLPPRGAPPRLGSAQLLKAYSTMPWLRAVVQKSSWAFATLQWQLFVGQRAGKAVVDYELREAPDWRARRQVIAAKLKAGELRKVETSPLLDFLSGSNPWFPGLVRQQLTQQHLDLVGEACWILERNGAKRPLTAVPIPPTWVQQAAAPGRPYFEINGLFGHKDLPESEVVWFYHPDPANPFARGTGTAGVLGDELETDELAAKYLKAFFTNDARPPLVVTGEGMDKTDAARLEQKWLEKRVARGPHAPMFLPGKNVKIQDLGQTFREMQLGELRRFERDIIIQIFGFPPEELGIIENSNRATIDAADLLFAKGVTFPRAEFARVNLQNRLVPEFDDRLILDYVSPIAADREYELKVMQAASWAPTLDEWRAQAGLPPEPNGAGQVHLVPFALTPMRELGAPASTPEPAAPKSLRLVRRDFTSDDLDRVLAAVDPALIAKYGREAVAAAVAAFGQQAIEGVGSGQTFQVTDPRVQTFISEWAGDRIKGLVDDTTKSELRATINEGLANGETMRDLADRVSATFDQARASRAMTIARTEVARASNFGALEGMQQAGVESKEWLATQDDRVRDEHAALDGQQRPIDAPFVVPDSGEEAMYPGGFGEPGLDINCRCGVLSVLGKADVPRVARWKALEAERLPYDRRLAAALKKGFTAQEQAVLAALAAAGGEESASWQAA